MTGGQDTHVTIDEEEIQETVLICSHQCQHQEKKKVTIESEFNAAKVIRAIRNTTMGYALDLLNDYDIHRQWTEKISPGLVLSLNHRPIDEAIKWLVQEMPQDSPHEPRTLEQV